MPMGSKVCAALLLLAAAADASSLLLHRQPREVPPHPETFEKCSIVCHSYFIKGLQRWRTEFANVTDPKICDDKCQMIMDEIEEQRLKAAGPPVMTASRCQKTCHKFDFESLGEDFVQLESPWDCAALCVERYPEAPLRASAA
mmetsp:Transcript_108052/g.348775  ORF Transcript_108052/g.348775 Transcript_108052/m.348775 type:complete len:143 (-) Transcript_108052:132-560(-)